MKIIHPSNIDCWPLKTLTRCGALGCIISSMWSMLFCLCFNFHELRCIYKRNTNHTSIYIRVRANVNAVQTTARQPPPHIYIYIYIVHFVLCSVYGSWALDCACLWMRICLSWVYVELCAHIPGRILCTNANTMRGVSVARR